MILQSENPVRMVRELKGAPLSIVMVLSLVHQRVTQEYLERATGYTDKPVSQALAYLQEVGLADHTLAGWQLIKENEKQLPLTIILTEGAVKRQKDATSVAIPSQPSPEDPPDVQPSGEGNENIELSRNYSDSLNYLSKKVVVDINNFNTSTPNLLNLTPQVGKIPTLEEIEKVLDAGAKLFGRPIMGDPRDYANIDRLISWIAQAYRGSYDQGVLKIKNPAGLVYWAFHQGKDRHAEKKYIEKPEQYLPESFMDDSGQWEFADEEKLYE